ncbi:MAG: M67 family metallopeptidase [Bacteroidetes bacterium]|nr:M67 family metallopeptidase [Bacteroidota bacterium]MBS1609757.1 M67 family metallopeptidase [Bacteroidota bacterium]
MLVIEQKPLDEMINDAVRTFPDECCGFLFGKEDSDSRTVIKIQVVDNAKEGDKRRRFMISAKDYLKAEQFADENNLQLMGVYHSHPNHPAIPSEHDRVAAQPYFSYIILSVMNNEFDHIRSWQLNQQQQFEEEKVLIQQLN